MLKEEEGEQRSEMYLLVGLRLNIISFLQN